MEIATWITAISTLIMAVATIIMAIAAWQAKNSFVKQKGYYDYLELQDILYKCRSQILFLPAELMDESYRKNFAKEFNEKIEQISKLLTTTKEFLSQKKMKELIQIYIEILKFNSQLSQEACPYKELKLAHQEYLKKISELSKADCTEKYFYDMELRGN